MQTRGDGSFKEIFERRSELYDVSGASTDIVNPAIDLLDVFFQRENRKIISNFSLRIDYGEICVLLGRSGCGKTTVLKLINRLLEPARGEIRVDGRSTKEWDPIQLKRHIGYVIQEVGLFPHMTVGANLGLLLKLERWEAERIDQRVKELLEMIGLEPQQFGKRYPSELSGGQRQRVGVARALALDPPILLMDEPFGALDPLTRQEIQAEFLALQGRLKKTVVLVTHDLREALLLGTRIVLLREGRIAALGTPQELLSSRDVEIMQYLKPLRDVHVL
ncbi:MAG: ATP-binding cassette domain-containing protein [Acidobacteria bacterium]|nr:ATP-binding cassette domain-containing protein [Acidobacteriota bacterium]